MRNNSLKGGDADLDKSSAFCVVERVYGYGFMSLRLCNDTSQRLRYFFLYANQTDYQGYGLGISYFQAISCFLLGTLPSIYFHFIFITITSSISCILTWGR
jgi:hypothetical protein